MRSDLDASLRQAPRRHGLLRRGAQRALESTCRLAGGRALYRRLNLLPGRFVVRTEELCVPGLPRGLDGFTIAQLSDLHAGPFLRAADLRAVVDAVARRAPDVCALTGDFITHTAQDAFGLAEVLGAIPARHGTFAVFGNHDYRGRREGEIAAAFARAGVRFLRDAAQRIDSGDGVLALVGLEDLEEARAIDVERARAGLSPGDVEVVLCHNPLGARALARPGCAAILSGHTHGGQVALPLLERLGPSHPGLRVAIGGTTLIVSRGLGVIGVPLRVRAPAEVVLVRLARERV